jgi:hypothetical protein
MGGLRLTSLCAPGYCSGAFQPPGIAMLPVSSTCLHRKIINANRHTC